MTKFSFGDNWTSFARTALTADRIDKARLDFQRLMNGIALQNKSFLDIGFGQGLALFLAAEAGAIATGIDVDPRCQAAAEATRSKFPRSPSVSFECASILDSEWVGTHRQRGGYTIVHSWGVLHHTGAMKEALVNAATLVRPGGHLVIAIYNAHWTSPLWKIIKWAYNYLPAAFQRLLVQLAYPLYVYRLRAVGGGVPDIGRGMEVIHDLRDWLGGYPYEYASVDRISELLSPLGFETTVVRRTTGWTGCNEFVFKKRSLS